MLYPKTVLVCVSEVHLLQTNKWVLLFFSPICQSVSLDQRVKTITIQISCFKMYINFCHFVMTVSNDSILILIYFSTILLHFILFCDQVSCLYFSMVVFPLLAFLSFFPHTSPPHSMNLSWILVSHGLSSGSEIRHLPLHSG